MAAAGRGAAGGSATTTAGERAVLDVERGCDEAHDAHVGGHLVPDAELDDVPGDEFPGGERGEPLPVAEHGGVVGLDLPQRVERLLGVGLLPDSDGGVDDEDEEDDERLDEGGERDLPRRGEEREEEGDGGGGEQDADERVLELLREELQQRRARVLGELVGPVRAQPRRGVRRREPPRRRDPEPRLAVRDGARPRREAVAVGDRRRRLAHGRALGVLLLQRGARGTGPCVRDGAGPAAGIAFAEVGVPAAAAKAASRRSFLCCPESACGPNRHRRQGQAIAARHEKR